MKLKKIFAFFLACCIACTCLVVPASASTKNLPSNWSHFISDLSDDFNAYRNGNITLTDFFDLYAKNCLKWGYNNVSDVTHFKDVLKGLENLGYDVPSAWEKYFYEYNEIEKDDSILNGYDCAYFIPRGNSFLKIFGKNGVFKKDGSVFLTIQFIISENGVGSVSEGNSSHIFNSTYIYYGNWNYEDGSSADDKTSDLPYKQMPNYDDDSIPEDDLIDFFDKLLEDLKLQFPDLSTIEGLLSAILAKLGTLDSDNDNELLMQILTAIQALKNSGETADNSELLKTLEELKNALVFKDGEKVSSLAELLNQLVQNQVRRSDITIDESLYNQRYSLIETKLLGKFSFISEIKNFVQYAIDSYSSSSENPSISISLFGLTHSMDFSAFDDNIDLIRFCVAAFVYLTFAFNTFRRIPGYINGGDNE